MSQSLHDDADAQAIAIPFLRKEAHLSMWGIKRYIGSDMS